MLNQSNPDSNRTTTADQDKYQLALDEVIKQMNLLSDDPSNENLRLAHEQARQRFLQTSNMEKNEYEKFIHSKLSKGTSKHSINPTTNDHIQSVKQSHSNHRLKVYLCCFLLIFLFSILTIICIIELNSEKNT